MQGNAAIITTTELESIFRNIDSNTKFLVDASAANERSSASLQVMQVGAGCEVYGARVSGKGLGDKLERLWSRVWGLGSRV